MTIRLLSQIEDNRFIIVFLDGAMGGMKGDYRIEPKRDFKEGEEIKISKYPRFTEPTCAFYCGQLIESK